jgi:hypothetical protein
MGLAAVGYVIHIRSNVIYIYITPCTTEGFLDDVQSAVDDGINAYKVDGAYCIV